MLCVGLCTCIHRGKPACGFVTKGTGLLALVAQTSRIVMGKWDRNTTSALNSTKQQEELVKK